MVEQTIGQLLWWGQYLHEETIRLQRLQAQLERQVAALEAKEEAKEEA